MGEAEVLEILVKGAFAIPWIIYKALEWLIPRLPKALEFVIVAALYIVLLPIAILFRSYDWLHDKIFAEKIRKEKEVLEKEKQNEEVKKRMNETMRLRELKTDLLVKFEDLRERKKELHKSIYEKRCQIEKFEAILDDLLDERMTEKELGKEVWKKRIEAFDASPFQYFDDLRNEALELEQVLTQMYFVEKKLWYFKISRDWHAK